MRSYHVKPNAAVVAFLALSFLLFCQSVRAQVFVPIDKTNPVPSVGFPSITTISNKNIGAKILSTVKEENLNLNSLSATVLGDPVSFAPNAFPTCSPIPSLAQVSASTEYNQTLMSTNAAAKLGIPFLKLEGSLNQMVLVRDFTRSAICPASDGTNLKYGQTIRMIITISNYSAQGDLSLPVIAANATVNLKNNKVNIVVYGLANPAINSIIGNLSSKELNVESYGDFTKATSQMIELIDKPETIKTVERLGIIPNVIDVTDYKPGVVAGFALTQMSKGKSCSEAKANFQQSMEPIVKAIDDTYIMMIGSCDGTKPSDLKRLEAKQYLSNLKVDY